MKIQPCDLISALEITLKEQGCDYMQIINDFGQLRASEDRKQGKRFTLPDHIRGLILSLLSNRRPWGPIARNVSQIENIFFQYDPHRIVRTDPSIFVTALQSISCGNISIRTQMVNLHHNIRILDSIEQNGSLDSFVTNQEPWAVADKFASAKSPYKLKSVGPALALEYLKNVGIRGSKPDEHVRRFLSDRRLGFFPKTPSEEEAYDLLDQMAAHASCNPIFLDNLIWIFCAKNYGNICGARPQCHICHLRSLCSYGSMNYSSSLMETIRDHGSAQVSWPSLDSKGIGVHVNKSNGNRTVVFLGCLPSSQSEFEASLRGILELLENLHRSHSISNIIFPGGGTLEIPKWFIEWCNKLSIRIEVEGPIENPAHNGAVFLRDAYKAIRHWYRKKVNLLISHPQLSENYRAASIKLINILPAAGTVTEPEMWAVLGEVLCGYLEWAYHESDGNTKMSSYARLAAKAVGRDLNLSDEEKEFLENQSALWPLLWINRPSSI